MRTPHISVSLHHPCKKPCHVNVDTFDQVKPCQTVLFVPPSCIMFASAASQVQGISCKEQLLNKNDFLCCCRCSVGQCWHLYIDMFGLKIQVGTRASWSQVHGTQDGKLFYQHVLSACFFINKDRNP